MLHVQAATASLSAGIHCLQRIQCIAQVMCTHESKLAMSLLRWRVKALCDNGPQAGLP